MIELGVNQLGKYYGATKIFENISFEIQTRERVALIGSNGVGKTTLLKILMGEEENSEGGVFFRKGAKVGYLEQTPDYGEEYTVLDVMMDAFEGMVNIEKSMRNIEKEMIDKYDDAKLLERYGKLQDEYEVLGGYEIQEKLSKISQGLDISDHMGRQKFCSLSGGEKSRVLLAKILLEKPDILLLDEPSNHLDLRSIEWLEGFLKTFEGAVLVISHDRYFLDRVINKIVEMEFNNTNIYLGNYTYYIDEKQRRFEIALKEYKAQERKIKTMEAQIERFRIWGAMRDSDKMYKKAKELEKRLEKVDKLDRPVEEKEKMKLSFDGERSGKEVLRLVDIGKSFGSKNLFKELNLNLYYKDTLCIIGENGTGKTTLINIILNNVEMDEGAVKLGSKVELGYLAQELDFGDEELTILEYYQEAFSISSGEARGKLAKTLFTRDQVMKKIKNLSGGEKSRLKLAELMNRELNLLILDEPTNHLDIESREILEHSLMEFKGTILFISHDRYFIDKMSNRIVEIENKRLSSYDGDYKYYTEEKKKKEELEKESEMTLINEEKISEKARNTNFDLSSEVEMSGENLEKGPIDHKKMREKKKEEEKRKRKIENRIKAIEEEINEIEKEKDGLNREVESCQNDFKKLTDLLEKIDEMDEKIFLLLEEWEKY